MLKFLKWYRNRKRIRVIKAPDGGEVKLLEAFKWRGITYYQIENAFDMKTGRALCAITYYEEFQMRCDRDYLEKHCRAVDILMSDPKTLKIGYIAMLHENLKNRVGLAPYPDHIYKLASVMFFDKTEEVWNYDFKYNQEKIKAWKEDPELLSFLVQEPLRALMPFGEHAKSSLETYFLLKEQENQDHLKHLDRILSKTT